MKRKEDTPKRIIARRYEKLHKEEREKATLTFGTNMKREKVEEINEFLEKNKISKVTLIEVGYETLKQQFNKNN